MVKNMKFQSTLLPTVHWLAPYCKNPEARRILLSSSDLSRVKIIRRDAKTGKNHEWTVDCSNAIFDQNPDNARDLWLRNGDVIEVPEKP